MPPVEPTYRLPAKAVLLFQSLSLLGGIALAMGLFLTPQRTWANVLVLSNYLLGLGLGGLLIVALHYVTGAQWSVPVRRVPEAMTAVLPVGAMGMVAVLLFRPSLYRWLVAADQVPDSPLGHLWLNRPFFLLRALAYLAVWMAFAAAIVRTSRRQDGEHDAAPTATNLRLSAAFLVAFGFTCWLASSDWIMSLEPKWSSTIFGVYNFAGILLTSLAAVTLLALWLQRHGPLSAALSEDHFHDLATLLFGFSSFWMYIWFCQYLLIWYANQPEETTYYVRRWQGTWPGLMLLDVVFNWGIPFCLLLFRAAKRSPGVLGAICLLVLIGRWFDLFVMIFPSQGEAMSVPGVLELGLLCGAAGVTGLIFFWSFGNAPVVPRNDPRLCEESSIPV
ncbi:MAG: hypothetical protein ACYC3I_28170 [Gemmataceae bacterium]